MSPGGTEERPARAFSASKNTFRGSTYHVYRTFNWGRIGAWRAALLNGCGRRIAEIEFSVGDVENPSSDAIAPARTAAELAEISAKICSE